MEPSPGGRHRRAGALKVATRGGSAALRFLARRANRTSTGKPTIDPNVSLDSICHANALQPGSIDTACLGHARVVSIGLLEFLVEPDSIGLCGLSLDIFLAHNLPPEGARVLSGIPLRTPYQPGPAWQKVKSEWSRIFLAERQSQPCERRILRPVRIPHRTARGMGSDVRRMDRVGSERAQAPTAWSRQAASDGGAWDPPRFSEVATAGTRADIPVPSASLRSASVGSREDDRAGTPAVERREQKGANPA